MYTSQKRNDGEAGGFFNQMVECHDLAEIDQELIKRRKWQIPGANIPSIFNDLTKTCPSRNCVDS